MAQEWRKGLPKHTWGLAGRYLFEVLLSDLFENNKVVEAYVKKDEDGENDQWHKNGEDKVIPVERVVGWRETFTCSEAKIAIDEYVRKSGYGAITKENFSQAWFRHLHMDSDEFVNCEDCWNYYLLKTGQEYSLSSPEELLKIKQVSLTP